MATNTATSFTNHTAPGSGSTAGPYAISFSYLDQSDVDVTVNGTLQALGVKYTFTSGTQITFTSGNEPPNGAAIVIKRDTNISAKKVDFQDGAVLTETDLDTNSDQLLFGLQEFTDKINGIEDGATGDQTPADILAAIVQVDGAGSGLDSDKLDGQEGSYYVDYSNLTNKHANLTALESGSINNIAIGVTTPAAGVFSSLTVDFIVANHNILGTYGGYNLQLTSSGGNAYTSNGRSYAAQTTRVMENLAVDGNLTVTGNINQSGTFQLSGTNVTSSAAELNVLDGITSTTAELNILDGVTANATNINIVTGMSKQTTISDSDTAFPTSGAVVDYFAARNIGDLANVDTTGVADGKILKYQSSSNKFIIADDTAASNNAFTGLSDTPANFTGAANKTLKINAAGNAVEFVTVTTPSGNIVDDTTPQLGGNLDVNGNDIVSVSNGNIKLSPNGTGDVQITSDLIVDTTTLVVDATNNKVGIGTATPSTALEVNGTVTATTFAGSGASLTNLPAANITGTLPAISGANLTNLDAADLASGTIPSDRFGTDTIATGSLAAGALPTDVTIADTNISGNLTIESADIVDGTIVNADINASAAIAKSKLASLDIVNADVNASAAIAGSKISPDFGSQNIQTTGNLSATETTSSDIFLGDSILHTGDTNTKIRFPSNDVFAVETGGNERFRINDDGVGIGTTSPTSSLHVSVGSSGTNSSAGFNEFCIEGGNEDIGMCFLSPAANERTHTIAFGDSNNNNAGKIEYNHSTDDLTLTASDNIILTGDAVLIGTTTKNSNDKFLVIDPGDVFMSIRSDAAADNTRQFLDFGTGTGDRSSTNQTGSIRASIHSQSGGTLKSDLIFQTNSGNSITDKLIIKDNGRVGIGTTSPTGKLTVHNTDDANVNVFEVYNDNGNMSGSFSQSSTGDGTVGVRKNDGTLSVFFRSNGISYINGGNVGIGTTSPNNTLDVNGGIVCSPNTDGKDTFELSTNALDEGRLSIKNVDTTTVQIRAGGDSYFNGGNVGIGTTSPNANLESEGNVASTTQFSGFQGLRIQNANGAAHGVTADINFVAGTGSNNRGAVIGAEFTSAASGNDLYFATNPNSVSSNDTPIERIRILSSGHVLFNCTSLPSSSVAGAGFEKNGSQAILFSSSGSSTASSNHAEFLNGNGVVGTINTNGSATSYNTSSDYRLKENATAISDGITRIKTLKPYRFNFIADSSKTVDGFFAHEVTAVPEAITGTKDEVDSDNNPVYQGIDQSKLVPLLVAAVQELIGKVEALEAA